MGISPRYRCRICGKDMMLAKMQMLCEACEYLESPYLCNSKPSVGVKEMANGMERSYEMADAQGVTNAYKIVAPGSIQFYADGTLPIKKITEVMPHKPVGPGVLEVTDKWRLLSAQLELDHLRHDAMISECRQREHLFDQDALEKRLRERG